MNIWTSECSSGCESGWTTYFDQFSNSTNPYSMNCVQNYEEREAYVRENHEDEDLSMVSDASSGPPNLRENYASEPQYYGYASSVQEDTKKHKQQKSRTKETKVKKQNSFCLDDTASSSSMLHFSQDNAVLPENHNSVQHFESESIPRKRLGFLKSSTKGKSGSFLGRKRQ